MSRLIKIISSVLLIFIIVFSSCSTEILNMDADDGGGMLPGIADGIVLRVNREPGTDKENQIESLWVAFYQENSIGSFTFRGIEKAMAASPDGLTYTVEVPASVNRLPTHLIAVANYDFVKDGNITSDPLTDKVKSGYGSDCFLMANARYFNNNKEEVFLSEIKEENLESPLQNPVIVNLERNVAKVIVTSKDDYGELIQKNLSGDDVAYNLTLDGWSIGGCDRATYVVKHPEKFSYEDFEQELGANGNPFTWNEDVLGENYKFLNWAHSAAWNCDAFPKDEGDYDEDSPISLLRYDEVTTTIGSPAYFNESTRLQSSFDKLNGVPYLIVTGRYSRGDNVSDLFRFKSRNEMITREDFMDMVAEEQSLLFANAEGEKPDAGSLSQVIEIGKPEKDITGYEMTSGMVTVKLKPEINLETFYKSGGELWSEAEREEINRMLYQQFGIWEYYKDGRCYFIARIEHFGKVNDEAVTGSYGLVRNNFYNIFIDNVSGPGRGVGSTDQLLTENDSEELTDPYTLQIRVGITPWFDVYK